MVLCNIFAIYLGTKIFQAGEGTQLPNPKYFGCLGLEALLATTSLGHVIGFGVIIGVGAAGLLLCFSLSDLSLVRISPEVSCISWAHAVDDSFGLLF